MKKGHKAGITIKGTREGLVFLLDDNCPFADLLAELQQKLGGYPEESQIWNGPRMNVRIKLGRRCITPPEEKAVRDLFSVRENLVIQSFEGDHVGPTEDSSSIEAIRLLSGTIRSGQVLDYRGDVLFLGDINPGGAIHCSGSIYVIGSLRGIAHAGNRGDTKSIIVASSFLPTQLRIAGILSRPPEDWETLGEGVRFAHVVEKRIVVEKACYLDRIRPGYVWWRMLQSENFERGGVLRG
ncbi:septum site-determining protein MinC [Pasteuria penetrans]|uniref:septum site-determining protein MinC n=1 Tax=Pasteuria penetrans TaxID=86005 RepID=UPI000F94DD18|nr:septum site-determining protein MinC [Pasteuria penetrans]